MLYILFSLLLIFPVFIGFGYVFQRYMGILWEGLSGKILSGMLFLMFFWHLLAFFYPVNFYVELGSLLVGWGLFLYFRLYKDFRSFKKNERFLLCGFVIFSLLIGSGYPFILDHFGYYTPSIKWISEVGLVKGITNLDWVLGQMSPWHILQAGFSHFSDEYLRLNTLLLILFFIYILEKNTWGMLCFIPILFFFGQSPSPDLPSIVFSLMILREVLEKNKEYSILFAFSMVVFSIKPTMFWLPVLTFFYSIFCRTNIRFIALGSAVFVLYLVKNIWVFGYPLFPMQVLDLGIDWKPYAKFFTESREIAMLKTFDFQYTIDEIAAFSFGDYVKNWMFLEGIKGIINIAFIFSLLGLGIYALLRRNQMITLVFISVFLKSLFVLWFSAQYRFFIEVFFVVFMVILGKYFSKKYVFSVFGILGTGVTILLLSPRIIKENVPSFHLGSVMRGFEWEQLYRPSHYVFNQYETFRIGNLKFNVPRGYIFNFDIDLPGITLSSLERFERFGIFPQLQGKDFKDGFIWKELSPKEREELREVINKIKNRE